MKRVTLVLGLLGLLCVMSTFSMAQSIDSYHAAIDRLVVSYSHVIIDIGVAIGENDPAKYALEMWTKGKDVSASVIVDASAPFMLGLAFLEKEGTTTAWWPTIEKEKKFASSQSEEEIGLGMGMLDRVIWHGEDYEATFVKDTDTRWGYRVTPKDPAAADFSYGIIDVNKSDGTLVRAEFYDADDKLIETDSISDYQEIATDVGGTLLYPLSFAYEDLTDNKKTTMEYSTIEFPESIDDSVFTLDFLKARSAAALN